jgi:tetratricopeptide (TPR) repeat protein
VTPDFGAARQNPALMAAALALAENRLHDAEPLLKAQLKANPFEVTAMRMLAELAARIGRYPDAENLLRRAVELSPGFLAARSNLATVLYRQNKPAEAIAELEAVAGLDPDNPGNANLKAAAHGRLGDYAEAIALYETVLAKYATQPKVWMSYGHVLKTVGRQADAIAAYRQATGIAPQLGEVWWSLANLKTFAFADADIAAMQAALKQDGLKPEDRFHLHFALGKAHEDRKDAVAAFGHYETANQLRREVLPYDQEMTTAQVDRAVSIFTPEQFAKRGGKGCPDADPIFIVGMPRAGSTLVEQILSSHSLVEGTMEHPDMPALAARVGAREGGLAAFSDDELAAMGAEYLDRTRIQRKTGKRFFIDKLPNNWAHVGLIRLVLPNAKIIDARRHPLGCCFSNFKQHFARGQAFSYGLADMGRYYADYVRLMAHFDAVQPGAVHRVIYEAMVDDTEAQIRTLLEALDLPFEDACLRWWENDRAVRTASSEQVRKPIFREGTEGWQAFEPWLDPLKAALGPVLDCYPDVPAAWTKNRQTASTAA